MKQDLQNLRDEIKQLGRDIRAQLKGELLGPQTLSSDPAQLLVYLGSVWPREASDIYPGHTAGLRLESPSPGFQSKVLSTAYACLSGSLTYNETIDI